MNTTIITTTLGQMAFLFSLILIGWVLAKRKIVPENTSSALSKLENWVFLPALVFGTFSSNCSVEKIGSLGTLLLGSIAVLAVVIPISYLVSKCCTKDAYIRKIYLYGLCFSNFSFMGNAVVSALFPDYFMEYVMFTMVLWVGIYLWGAPALLIGDSGKQSFRNRMKSFLNPMLIGMVLGVIVGLTGFKLPAFVNTLMTQAGNCMSPIAMLLTGMALAAIDLKKVLSIKSIYAVSLLRLLVYPIVGIFALVFLPFSEAFVLCTVCSLAMPMGLNTIVIPAAYGKDTTFASGMALVSHAMSVITIPIVFWILNQFLNL